MMTRPDTPVAAAAAAAAVPDDRAGPSVELSIVVPCLNEQDGLPAFLTRMTAAAVSSGLTYEIVLVDDGSTDATWATMQAACAADPHLRGIRLSRNFGHQRALSAGLMQTQGARVLLIDADLQDPPEALVPMLALMKAEQADVVYGRRMARAGEGWLKRASAGLFYRVLRWLSSTDIPADTGDFRLLSATIVARLNVMPEQHRFLRGMIAWLGGRQVPYDYQRAPRAAGQSGYPLRRMVSFATDAITGFSMAPLRLCTGLAVVSVLIALGLLVYVVASVVSGSAVRGWASLMMIFLFFQSVQLLCLGLVGEYLGRLFMESKNRPLFIITEQTPHGDERSAIKHRCQSRT